MRNQFVILAAGKGTRMGQSNVPKVLVMLNNKPLILYVLGEIEKINQLIKPVVVMGHQSHKVQGVLGDDYLYAYQDKQLGTAHALLSAKRKIRADNIVVLHGDMPFIKAESLKQLIKKHFNSGANISLLASQVDNYRDIYKSLEHYGRIIRDPHHNIVGTVEFRDASPAQKQIKEINAAVYMFNTKWLWANLEKIENKNSQTEYYLTDIINIAARPGEKVNCLAIDPKEVIGVNSLDDLAIAEKLLKS